MIQFFPLEGKILDPCRGSGQFSNKIKNCEWCEISEGKDFFDYTNKVDYIISNPPYSILNKFTRHALTLSDNVIWLVPVWKIFQAYGLIKTINQYGGIKHIRWYGTGAKLKFPMGNAIGAVHIRKNYKESLVQSFYEDII